MSMILIFFQLIILMFAIISLLSVHYYFRSYFHMMDSYESYKLKSAASYQQCCLPNTLIIGVAKCGTRAVIDYLGLHPSVEVAPEETAFFAHEEINKLGLHWYANECQFTSGAFKVRVEKSPQYFITPTAPEKVYAFNSSIKLILVVRDPVTRLISDHMQRMDQSNQLEQPLDELVYLSKSKRSIRMASRVVNVGLYHLHLSRWLKFFPKRQIHVVDGEALAKRENPYKEMSALEEFLELPKFYTENSFFFNKTKGYYCPMSAGIVRCLTDNKGRRHPPVHPKIVEDLRHFYNTRNGLFFTQVGRQFNWSET